MTRNIQIGIMLLAFAAKAQAASPTIASIMPPMILGAALSSAWNWLIAIIVIIGLVMIVQGARKLGNGEEGILTLVGGVLIVGAPFLVKYMITSSGGDATAGGLLP